MFLNWENEQDRMRSPKLVPELTKNTLSMQGIAVTRSYSDITSAITKVRPQQDVNFTGCKLQLKKAYFCDEEWY